MPDIRFVVYDPPQDVLLLALTVVTDRSLSCCIRHAARSGGAQCRPGHRGSEGQIGRPRGLTKNQMRVD